MRNLNSDMKKQITAALFFFVYNLMIGCSKKNRENYQPENAFEQKKKKPRIKFNPGLAIIGLWITGPRPPCDSLTCSSSSSVPRILPTSYTRHTLSSVPAWFWGRNSKNAELFKEVSKQTQDFPWIIFTGFVQIFGSKIQDFFQTFFPKQ